MKKIPTLFVRDPENLGSVLPEVHPDCQWVVDGEGTATRKYDGTCVKLEYVDGELRAMARREVKKGKNPPPNFVTEQVDWTTGKTVGWEPMEQSSFRKFFQEAMEPVLEFGGLTGTVVPAGTYELIGPKINGNPEGADCHRLESHANAERIDWTDDRPGVTFFESMRDMVLWLAEDGIEGVVWHHPDGRMAKLKGRDFK